MTEQETCELTLLRHAIEALREEVESLQVQVASLRLLSQTIGLWPNTIPNTTPAPWTPYPITYGATSNVSGAQGTICNSQHAV